VNLGFRVSFVVAGVALLAGSIALLIDFRGLGKRWDEDVYAYSKEVMKHTRVPWSRTLRLEESGGLTAQYSASSFRLF
jgi:hypothetical protein